LPPAYLLVLAQIISSTLKMEAICFSETPVATQQTTRRHIPEDDTLHEVVLPKKTPEAHFITSVNTFSVALL
jgi:hypothetical protein